MVNKLLGLNVNPHIVSWILEFLTARPQYVKVNGLSSEQLITNTGAPQGCVLSPVLYTIYTNDYRSHHESTKIIKFADDSSIIGLLQDNEIHYQNEVQGFVGWCQENFLFLL